MKEAAERHRRAKEIFLQACELQVGERLKWVSEICRGDDRLRGEVERLLAFHMPVIPGKQPNVPIEELREVGARVNVRVQSQRLTELPTFETGAMVAGRFKIVSLLGEGAMGRVYRAEDVRLHQPVALKFLPRLHVIDPAWRQRVEREVNLSREISHPNICRVHDLGEENGSAFISMEFVDGEDLASLLRRVGRLTGDRAIDIARQACAGLAAAHIHGVLHRDLKPANIMIDDEGRVRITDFGLAAMIGHVQSGEICAGTPRYMAPEQIAGISVTERSDIYSLGLVFYEMFTGQRAFDAANVVEYAQLHRSVMPVAPSSIVPEIDPKVEAVIMACLRKDPAERPASALVVAAALPGGDILAAALAAGQIPTREMLAESAATGPTDRPSILKVAVATVALLVSAVLLGLENSPLSSYGGTKSPDALTERCEQLIVQSGRGSIRGISERRIYLASDDKIVGSVQSILGARVGLAAQDSDQMLFYYRRDEEGLRTLVSAPLAFIMLGASSARFESQTGGVSTVILDGQGRPLLMQSKAALGEAPPTDTPPLTLEGLCALGGFDPKSLVSVPSILRADYAGGVHKAFSARRACGESSVVARIEIDGTRDRVSSFAILKEPEKQGEVAPISIAESRYTFVRTTRNLVLLILLAVGIPGAWKGARDRGDFVGAAKLGLFVLIMRFVGSQLSMPEVSTFDELIDSLASGAISALCEGLIVSVFYLAIESQVRRLWPRTLGCWSRVLLGKIRDPFVGRDVLIGCLFGCFWAAMIYLEQRLPGWMGWNAESSGRFPARTFIHLFGSRFALAGILSAIRDSIYQSLVVLFLLVLATRIAGPYRRAALVVTWLICSAMYSLAGSNPFTAWLLISVGCVSTALYLVVRWGLLSLIIALFVLCLLTNFPLTAQLGAWYAGYGFLAILCVLSLCAWSVLESLRPPRMDRQPTLQV
ncbi:MAG: hypothetical protein AMXMBFR20_36700 [Planctomycetia bacterium]